MIRSSMSFHFPLQPIFRVRQSLEKLDREKLRISSGLEERLKAGMSAADFSSSSPARQRSSNRKKSSAAVRQAQEQRALQEQAFREAQRKRKIVENLRDLKLEIYRHEEARREQQRVDDLFGLRHAKLAK